MKIKLRKKIKKYGNTSIIQIGKDDLENYGWKVGDILEIKDIELVKNEN
ncbi:MAG: hypothetical protein ACOC56_06610 [Atribacterota bacterium]